LATATIDLKDRQKRTHHDGVRRIFRSLLRLEDGLVLASLSSWRLNVALDEAQAVHGAAKGSSAARLSAWTTAREILEADDLGLAHVLTQPAWRELMPKGPDGSMPSFVKQLDAVAHQAAQSALSRGEYDGFQVMRGIEICEAILQKMYSDEVTYRIKLWRTSYGIFKRSFALAEIQIVFTDLAGKSVRMSGKRNTTFETWLNHWCQYRKVPIHGVGLKYAGNFLAGVETAHGEKNVLCDYYVNKREGASSDSVLLGNYLIALLYVIFHLQITTSRTVRGLLSPIPYLRCQPRRRTRYSKQPWPTSKTQRI